ncbi:MAG: hypothetical protein R2713_18890 [Ilumatobacteraceae bacterium]
MLDTRTATTVFRGGGSRSTRPPSPAAVSAIAANWTLTETWRGGFLTVHPTHRTPAGRHRQRRPPPAGRRQFGITATSTSGLAAFSSSGTHLVVDVTGWFTGTPSNATSDVAAPNHPVADVDRRVLLVGDSTLAGVRWYTNSQHALVGSNFVLDAESTAGSSVRRAEAQTPTAQRDPGDPHDRRHDAGGRRRRDDRLQRLVHDLPGSVRSGGRRARAAGATEIIWLTYRERSTYTTPRVACRRRRASGSRTRRSVTRSRRAPTTTSPCSTGGVHRRPRRLVHPRRRALHDRRRVRCRRLHLEGRRRHVRRAVPGPVDARRFRAVALHLARLDDRCGRPDGAVRRHPSDIHCYEVGTDRHVECVDPKLAH